MKKVIIHLLLFFIAVSFKSQIIRGNITDASSGKALPFTSIVLINGKGIYADENGKFELDIKNSIHDTLKISVLGYQPKLFPLDRFKNETSVTLNIKLDMKVFSIEEVTVGAKKIRYTKKEVIGEEKEGNIVMTSLIGYETCLYLGNPENTNGKLKRVYIDLKGRSHADYIAMFNIKFYEYDEKHNQPGKELYHHNLYVYPENRKYRLWINVEDLHIKFPENGICIGVELINTVGKVDKYAKFGPIFRYTVSKIRRPVTWSAYHDKGWKNGSTGSKEGFINPMIGAEVLLP